MVATYISLYIKALRVYVCLCVCLFAAADFDSFFSGLLTFSSFSRLLFAAAFGDCYTAAFSGCARLIAAILVGHLCLLRNVCVCVCLSVCLHPISSFRSAAHIHTYRQTDTCTALRIYASPTKWGALKRLLVWV